MAGLQDIKQHIGSVKSTQQITRAMKMVAAAKLRKTQGVAVASRPYTHELEGILGRIRASAVDKDHPLMVIRPVKSICYILISGDRGLSGGYNASIIRKALLESGKIENAEISFITIGRKGREYLKRRNKRIFWEKTGIHDTPTLGEAQELARIAVDSYLDCTFDEIQIIYQKFISAVQQSPVMKQLLPIPHEDKEQNGDLEYLYEPGAQEVLALLLPQYINNVVFQALMEAKASEHGSTMIAMGAATDNANDMIDTLALNYNRLRQANITREISEIVGGANALQSANQ